MAVNSSTTIAINDAESVFCFAKNVFDDLDKEMGQAFLTLSSLSVAVEKETAKWAQKLPYHINLLDIWEPGEVDHSRILLHILRFKTPDGRFELLESLIDFIREQHGKFFKVVIDAPSITTEADRIDVCIQERGKYAIIIENKSNWAGDQPSQLARYIKKLRDVYGYGEDQIYVLYLPPNSSKDPDPQTWLDPDDMDNNFMGRFESRYVKFSFFDGVVPWLKHKVLPNVRYKDGYLLSTLTQYVDHWDGLTGRRPSDKEKNMSIEAIVKTQLGLSTDFSGTEKLFTDLRTIQQKMTDFSKVMGCLENLKNDISINLQLCFWEELAQQLQHLGYKADINVGLKDRVTAYYKESKETWPAIEFPFYESKVTKKIYRARVEVGCGVGGMGYYYGVRRQESVEVDRIQECLNKIHGRDTGNNSWYSLKCPAQEYALNWRTFESLGFSDITDVNPKKRENFLGGIANEIDNYIKSVLSAAKELGL